MMAETLAVGITVLIVEPFYKPLKLIYAKWKELFNR